MIESVRSHNRWVIVLCFLLAVLLAVFPIGFEWRWLRPEFVAVVVIYWVMNLPQQLGAGMAFMAGFFQDIIEGAVLGQHALALIFIAYICQLSYQRIRNYAVWQQACWIFLLVGIHQLFCNWVQSLSGYHAPPVVFLPPALMSAIIWPVAVILLDRLRVKFKVS